PRYRALEVDPMPLGQGIFAGEGGSRVAGVECPVAVAVLRVERRGTCGTAVRVALADDHRLALQLGIAGDDLEAPIDVPKLGGDAGLDGPRDEPGGPLGVEGDEGRGRAD